MAKKYMVRVYDCSFVQNFVDNYELDFDSFEEAKDYADGLMTTFAYAGTYEYTAEVYIRTFTLGAYEPIGYFEFDYMGYDEDLFDLVSDMDDMDELSNYSWHDMF
jgi:hypothetical protein